jgi:hypothetical protein
MKSGYWLPIVFAVQSLLGVTTADADPRDAIPRPRPEILDRRYNHNRYYPRPGSFRPALPPGYRPYMFHGSPYYFQGGAWYAPHRHGFVVVQPPIGLPTPILPPYYTTVWINGEPYHYADGSYYQWSRPINSYQIVEPPAASATSASPAPADPQASANVGDIYVYAKDGQTAEQQAADRYECHAWSRDQTGFDPTQPAGGVAADQTSAKRAEYSRATTACLEARGYSVR